jgi:predicted enzyme related to lactoylglutathione lyase
MRSAVSLALVLSALVASSFHPSNRAMTPSAAATESAGPNTANDHRIDYIEMPATNIAATKQFYIGAFGWKFTDYGPDYTSFEDGRLAGGFAKGPAAPAGGALIVIYATDLADAERRVQSAGGKIVKPPFSFPGGRRFHFADPSGNELAVWSER